MQRHSPHGPGFSSLMLLTVTTLCIAGVSARSETGVPAKPLPGHVVAWEFSMDVVQLNAAAAKPVKSGGSGIARLEYDSTTGRLRYQLSWSGLSSRVTNIELRGPANPTHSTKRRLTSLARSTFTPGSAEKEGHWEGEHVIREYSQTGFERLAVRSILSVMSSGAAYISVMTSEFPEGEIRGNLGLALSQ